MVEENYKAIECWPLILIVTVAMFKNVIFKQQKLNRIPI